MTFDELLDSLADHGSRVRRTGPQTAVAQRVAHEDCTESLSLRQADDGTLLVNDFAGCHADDIIAALGRTTRERALTPGWQRFTPSVGRGCATLYTLRARSHGLRTGGAVPVDDGGWADDRDRRGFVRRLRQCVPAGGAD